MNQTRQPKGIPVGGQYAENSHDEASTGLVGPGGKMSFGERRVAPRLTFDDYDDDFTPETPESRAAYLIEHDHIIADVTRLPDDGELETYDFVLRGPGRLPVGVTVSRGRHAGFLTPPIEIAVTHLAEGAFRAESPDYFDDDDSEARLRDFNSASRLRSLVGEERYPSYVSAAALRARVATEGENPPAVPDILRREDATGFRLAEGAPEGVWSVEAEVVGVPTTYYIDRSGKVIGREEHKGGRTNTYRGDRLKGGEWVGSRDDIFAGADS